MAGRDFELRLVLLDGIVRIEVSDARHECYPPHEPPPPAPGAESGYGLLLVATLAGAWGVLPRAHVGKTIWAELSRKSSE